MTTIQIDEKSKIGKNVLKMLKALAQIESDNSIKFLDEIAIRNIFTPTANDYVAIPSGL